MDRTLFRIFLMLARIASSFLTLPARPVSAAMFREHVALFSFKK